MSEQAIIKCKTCCGKGCIELEQGMRIKDCPSCRGSGRDIHAERDALQAECERLRTEIDSWEKCYKEIHAPALREAHDYISELRAELAAIKAQEPVVVGEIADYQPEHPAFKAPFRTVKWVDGRLPDDGTKLYAIPLVNPQLTIKDTEE